jgi:nucleotide-binding universal stress UspA family protein
VSSRERRTSALRALAEFTYTVRRLSIRDELVFKAVVRTLLGQTTQVWRYTDALDADLLVLGSEIAAAYIEPIPTPQRFKATLTVNAMDTGGEFHLSLPLRVGEVKAMLNRLGSEILGLPTDNAKSDATNNATSDATNNATDAALTPPVRLEGEQPRPALVVTTATTNAAEPQATPTPAGMSTATLAAQWPANAMLVLTRWPPQALLKAHPAHPKLAALITGRPSTAERVAEQSGVSLEVCRAFCVMVVKFEAARVVAQLPTPNATTQATPAPASTLAKPQSATPTRGLLSLIRARLGLGPKPWGRA